MNGSIDRIFMSPPDRRRAPGMNAVNLSQRSERNAKVFPKGLMVRPIDSYASGMWLSMARGGLPACCPAAPHASGFRSNEKT
jgi:hypothetical protein